MEEYSRDVLAKPLVALGILLKDIRDERFNPDATRSGRWQSGCVPRISVGGPVVEQVESMSGLDDTDVGDESLALPPDGNETGSMASGQAHGLEDEEDGADESSNTTDKEDSAEEEEAELAERLCPRWRSVPGGAERRPLARLRTRLHPSRPWTRYPARGVRVRPQVGDCTVVL